MARRLFAHLRQQWIGVVALLLVLTGGTAYALDGSNTVFSDDLVNGEVKGLDLGADSVGSGKVADGSVKNADLEHGRLVLEHDRRWGHPGHRRQGRHPYGRRPRAGPKPDPAAARELRGLDSVDWRPRAGRAARLLEGPVRRRAPGGGGRLPRQRR